MGCAREKASHRMHERGILHGPVSLSSIRECQWRYQAYFSKAFSNRSLPPSNIRAVAFGEAFRSLVQEIHGVLGIESIKITPCECPVGQSVRTNCSVVAHLPGKHHSKGLGLRRQCNNQLKRFSDFEYCIDDLDVAPDQERPQWSFRGPSLICLVRAKPTRITSQ